MTCRHADDVNGVEHEQRATAYSKGATKGQRNEVWDSFDKRQKEKRPANDAVEERGANTFAQTGVAAE